MVGGRWFLDLGVLSVGVPFAISTSVLVSGAVNAQTHSWFETTMHYFALLGANIIAIAICALICILLSKFVFPEKTWRPVSTWWVILVGAGLGTVKGAATGFFAWIFEVTPDLSEAVFSRVTQTSLLGAWLIPTAAFVAAQLERYQQERDALVAERVRALLAKRPFSPKANHDVLVKFGKAAKAEVEASKGNLAQTIRSLVETTLRPISHEIWESENSKIVNFKISELVGISLRKFPFPAIWSASAFALSSFASQLSYVTFQEAGLRALGAWFLVAAFFKCFSFLSRFLISLSYLLLAAVPLATSVVIFFFTKNQFGDLPQYPPFETIVASWIWLLQLTVVGSLYLSIRSSRDEVREQLASHYSIESLDESAELARSSISNRKFASILHGKVQNQLLSFALRIESGEHVSREQALSEIDRILKFADMSNNQSNHLSLAESFAELASQWQGFASIEYSLPQNSETALGAKVESIVQIAEECVTNSIRHGLAHHIRFEIRLEGTLASLIAEDDGLGPRTGTPGLGSLFFDLVSAKNWTLVQRAEGGSRFQIDI
jgi:signal transduction histidine kinase